MFQDFHFNLCVSACANISRAATTKFHAFCRPALQQTVSIEMVHIEIFTIMLSYNDELFTLQIKMKWQYAILAFALFSAASAEALMEEEGDPRLGYISVGSDGTTSITFNATSIQNAVILGLFILVLGALILPLFGISLGSLFGSDSSDTGYGYGFDQATYDQGFESSANAYNSFSKR